MKEFFVAKKNGSLRLVTDYYVLNKFTIKIGLLPLVEKLFGALGGTMYFSKINLNTVYNQILIKEEYIPKTDFCFKFGSYEFIVLKFEMNNTLSTFVTYINKSNKHCNRTHIPVQYHCIHPN